jgi:DNA uptake protein ComE-like DNA-binding protein
MHDFEQVKKWFGYNRKERRASYILLIIIVVLVLVRVTFPNSKTSVQDVTEEFSFISAAGNGMGAPSPAVASVSAPELRLQEARPQPKVRKLIELNTADSALLESLPGIGPVLSVRIIKYRNLLGGFVTVDQLQEVYGISPETYNAIKTRVMVDTTAIRKVQVNSAEFRDLWRVPYLKRYDILAIIKYRDFKGKIGNLEELVSNKIVADSTARKVRPYLVF